MVEFGHRAVDSLEGRSDLFLQNESGFTQLRFRAARKKPHIEARLQLLEKMRNCRWRNAQKKRCFGDASHLGRDGEGLKRAQ